MALRTENIGNGKVAPDRAGKLAAVDDPAKHDYYHLFWIFLITSFFGIMVETIVSYPIDGVWKNRTGFLLGVISPIYGVGAILLTVLLYRLKDKNPVLLFLAASLLGGVLEYVAAFLFESAFGFIAWTYIDQPFNVQGKTCLAIALCWGLIGILWMRGLLPHVMNLIDRIPRRIGNVACAVLSVVVAVDVVMTLTAFNCWYERSAGLPVETPIQQFYAEHFGNGYMEEHFETISVYPHLALR